MRGYPFKAWLKFTPAAAIVVGLFGSGLVFALVQSLGFFPPLDEQAFTLVHYRELLNDRELWDSILLTLALSITSTAISAVVGILLAFSVRELVSRSPIAALLLQMPVAIPHLAVGVVVLSVIAPTGIIARILFNLGLLSSSAAFPVLVNDRLGIGLVIAYVIKEAPFIALMTYGVLARIGPEYEVMARTLGASPVQVLRHVLLPLTAPAALSSSLLVLSYTIGAFELPFLLGRSYPTMLSVVAQRRFMSVSLDQRPSAIALAIVLASLSILVAVVYGRVTSSLSATEKPVIF